MEVNKDFQKEANTWRQNKKINVRSWFDKIFDETKNAIKKVENAIKEKMNGPPACPIPEGPIERFICPGNAN